MRIAIVEDEQTFADELAEYITRFSQEYQAAVQCQHFKSSVTFLSSYQPVWDLLLLDIEMPNMDGMTLAHKIREIDQNVLLIFITKVAKYAMAGYEVAALDYVLKPVNYYVFSMKLRRVLSLLETKQKNHIVIQGNGFVRKIPVETIRYIDVLGHTISYHTPQGIISSTGAKSIRELESELSPDGFCKCNQCYLVNLQYVQSVEKDTVVLTGGECLNISRNRKKPFMQALLDFWGR